MTTTTTTGKLNPAQREALELLDFVGERGAKLLTYTELGRELEAGDFYRERYGWTRTESCVASGPARALARRGLVELLDERGTRAVRARITPRGHALVGALGPGRDLVSELEAVGVLESPAPYVERWSGRTDKGLDLFD